MKEVKDYSPSKDSRLIDCKTECGNGKCYAKRYGLFAEKTCPKFVEPKPITNGDRIRAMTDEELAEFITDDLCELLNCESPCDGNCDRRMLEWLKQEATE